MCAMRDTHLFYAVWFLILIGQLLLVVAILVGKLFCFVSCANCINAGGAPVGPYILLVSV